MAGKSITLKALRASAEAQVPPRLGVRIVAVFALLQLLLLLLLLLLYPTSAGATPLQGEVAVSTANGYARLVFTLAEETDAEVRLANGIVIIQFRKAVDISVDPIPLAASSYVGAARRDPDGTGVRLALNRKVTVNTMAAGEKLFVDLLPEGWTGLPPGLPQEVVEELAKRAREAEKKARQQLRVTQQRALPPVRVRVGVQPTFMRYTFALPQLIAVSTERADERVSFTFDAPLKFDLADVQAALPPMVASIDAQAGNENVSVRFEFIGKVDVRTFREDNNYVVDLLPIAPRTEAAAEPDKPKELSPLASALSEPRTAAPSRNLAQTPPLSRPAETVKAPEAPPSEKPVAPAGIVASKELFDPPATVPALESEDAKPRRPTDPEAPVVVDVRRQGEAVRLTFPFVAPTPAAVFRRADTLWLVFDSQSPIDINRIVTQSGRSIRNATVTRSREGQVVQLKLDKPKLTSIGAEGATWTVVVGDVMLEPTQPLNVVRIVQAGGRASVTIPFDQPQQLHRLSDTEVGDTLFVVTALGPARGFLKPQEFVEFNALVSTHGVVIQPRADDVVAEVTSDKVVVARPGGLTLSNASARGAMPGQIRVSGSNVRPASGLFMLDPQTWGFDREADFRDRQTQLVTAAAAAEEAQRPAARLNLARFYLARDLTTDAKGVLDVTASDESAVADGSAQMLRAVTNVMLGRGIEAMKDLSHAAVGNRSEAALWRALALAQQGKWSEAREGFHSLDTATATLPMELQRYAFHEAVRAAVEARDFGAAQSLLAEFETLGTLRERDADLAVLKGRVMEGLGRLAEALTFYRAAAESADRPAAARARLREVTLRQSIGEMKREEATAALEALAMTWRGDETEAEALQLLGRLYAEEGRYRDGFQVMRTALTVYPLSEMTRRIQDEAAIAFESLFLGGKGDAMPPIDALSLFYDFRDLTPVGRRGDEMIRKLADRLVSVDLLDQAAELLQHQVDNRLQGAARSQVAVRLAVIYLIARKPDRTIQVLRASRSGDLPNELRNQRLMIEARAQSETGRPELALEVIANLQGPEAERLRADILWKARRWRDTGEQIEKIYGDRWREFNPLAESERADILRAAVAYALADDTIGLDRFRGKYAPKMAEGPDRRAFEVVTTPFNSGTPEFGDVAKVVAAADRLEAFLRDIRAKFPEMTAPTSATQPAAPAAPGPRAAATTGKAG
jgi:tetratricopeptide (TPR) repeat protein